MANALPTYTTVNTFGASATKVTPDTTTYANGYLPGAVFPAQHENYFLNGMTSNDNQFIAQVNMLQSELLSLLTQYSISANGTTIQLRDLIVAQLALKSNLASPTFTGTVTSPTFASTVATGTAPFTVASTTTVANLSVATATDATNATNLTGSGTVSATATGGAGLTPTNATNATNATNTAITNDTTTSSAVYPTWVTANTGNLPQKTTSTKLTYVPSTGNLSTTTFTGALTGTATNSTQLNGLASSNYLTTYLTSTNSQSYGYINGAVTLPAMAIGELMTFTIASGSGSAVTGSVALPAGSMFAVNVASITGYSSGLTSGIGAGGTIIVSKTSSTSVSSYSNQILRLR